MNGLVAYGNSDDEEDGRPRSAPRKIGHPSTITSLPITTSTTLNNKSNWAQGASSSKMMLPRSSLPRTVHPEDSVPALSRNAYAMKLANVTTASRSVARPGPSSRQLLHVIRTPPPGDRQDRAASSSKLRDLDATLYEPHMTPTEEAARIRQLLRPPPIKGVEEWGIPAEPEGVTCDPTLEAKVVQFHKLKHQQPARHFNDTLMRSKAFRNPHIYAKLVDFVEVDETGTNFPKDIWDPFDVQDDWYADRIAEKQKERSEKLTASQAAGKRTAISFESKGKTSSSTNMGESFAAHSLRSSSSSSSSRKKATGGDISSREHYHPYEKEKGNRHRHKTDRDREDTRQRHRDRY
ncbi:hypothetical protein FRB95_009967 [Tulasnella sp. JGI-2019a]|nr:hypothetical protein FRB95_009967 [Tulasnella sp. JGI-2019a]